MSYQIVVDGDALVVKRRPDGTIRLRATKKDEFSGSAGTVVFLRDNSGQVNAFSLRGARVFDLRFKRE